MKRILTSTAVALMSVAALAACSSSSETPVSPPSSLAPVPVATESAAPSGSVVPLPSETPTAGETVIAGTPLPDDATITLSISRYGTVAPSEQATLDLTITKEESTILVVDKGETIMDQSVATDPVLWERLSVSYGDVKDVPSATECGVGGPSETLTITSGSETLTDITVQGCNGVEVGVGETELELYVTPALSQFTPPDAPASDSASPSAVE